MGLTRWVVWCCADVADVTCCEQLQLRSCSCVQLHAGMAIHTEDSRRSSMRASKSECCWGGVVYCNPAIAAFCGRFMLLNVLSSSRQQGHGSSTGGGSSSNTCQLQQVVLLQMRSSSHCDMPACAYCKQASIAMALALHACGKHTLMMPSWCYGSIWQDDVDDYCSVACFSFVAVPLVTKHV